METEGGEKDGKCPSPRRGREASCPLTVGVKGGMG
jgi:hypothetical protein